MVDKVEDPQITIEVSKVDKDGICTYTSKVHRTEEGDTSVTGSMLVAIKVLRAAAKRLEKNLKNQALNQFVEEDRKKGVLKMPLTLEDWGKVPPRGNA